MKYSKEELALIWLDSFLGLEYKHKEYLFDRICSNGRISENIIKNQAYIKANIGEKEYDTLLKSAKEEYLDYILKGLESRGITAITKYSKDYPNKLKNLAFSPLILYAKGNISLLSEKSFGIVGSRKSLPYSVALAEKYASELSKNGIVLVTGIAEGVDESVIKGAINNGKIISVIAGGFDKIYPAKNTPLAEEVAKKGLLISEHPPEVLSKNFLFPIRNRIIAGLSDGVLVVSAGLKSGTLYTAEYAEEYSRPVFAIPYTPNIESGKGTNKLIKQGAYLCDSVEDIFEVLGYEKKEEVINLTEEEKAVLEVIREGEIHVEKLSERLNKPVYLLTPILLMLEIKKLVTKSMGNVYSAV
ncbi:MAG: DNA-protecting protein DprA [Clostridiales bacterium]|nr:DNA-protecting protein DprA [Clostridiales bacterium]